MWEIELGYVILFGIGLVVSGIGAIGGLVWRSARKSQEHDDLVKDIDRIGTKLTATCILLKEHIAEANQRDKDMKERLVRIEDRFNSLISRQKSD